jgi:hypothetical protein
MQKLEDMRNAEKTRSTTRKPKKTFDEMLNAFGDCLSDLACSNNMEDVEDEEDEVDTLLGTLSEDDEPGWVMSTICERELHRMENLRQKQMTLDQLTQPEWGDVANYFLERGM